MGSQQLSKRIIYQNMDKVQVAGDLQQVGTTQVQRDQHDTLSYSALVIVACQLFSFVYRVHFALVQTGNENLNFNAACIFDCQL